MVLYGANVKVMARLGQRNSSDQLFIHKISSAGTPFISLGLEKLDKEADTRLHFNKHAHQSEGEATE